MKRNISTFTLMLLAIGGATASADNIFSDNFDFGQAIQTPLGTGNVDPYFQNDSTVSLSTFALFGSPNNGSVPACPAPESGNCLNLASAYDVSQVITRSPISLMAGHYQLTFQYAGSQRPQDLNSLDSASVSFGSLLTQSFSVAPLGGPQTFNFLFAVHSPTSANLVFTDTTPRPSNDDSDDGVLIDNIQMSTASSVAAPEPASVGLSAVAAVVVLACAFRRRTRSERAS
jgi:hypothetical protein